jgi:hypothetical protein
MSIDLVYHTPEEINENELDVYGFTIITDLEGYDSDIDEEE